MIPGRQYTPEELLRLLWNRRYILIAAALLGTLAAVALAMQLKNLYRSETMVLVIPQRISEKYVQQTVPTRIEDRLRSIEEETLSRTRLEKVINDFSLYPELRGQKTMEEIVAQMRLNIVVDTVRDDAFKVAFVSPQPRTAMIVADRLAQMFIEENLRNKGEVNQKTDEFLESRLEDARRRLQEHENKLKAFRQRYSGELPAQLESNLQQLRNTQTQIQALNESIDKDKDRRVNLEKTLADTLAGTGEPQTAAETKAVETTVDKLERAKAELREMETRLKPEYPDVIAKKRMIANLEKQVQLEAAAGAGTAPAPPKNAAADLLRQTRARGIQADIDKIDQQIAQKQPDIDRLKSVATDYQRRVDSVPGHESEYTALMRDYDTLNTIYKNLLAKREEAQMSNDLDREQAGEQFKVLDPARLPQKAYSPNRIRIVAIGFAAGLVLGFAIAGLLEYRDTSLRTEDEIVKMLVLPVVAAVPVLTSIAERRRQRRNLLLTTAASLLVVAGGVTGVLWRLGFIPGLR